MLVCGHALVEVAVGDGEEMRPQTVSGTGTFANQSNPTGGMASRQLLDAQIASLTQELEQLKKQRISLDGSQNDSM